MKQMKMSNIIIYGALSLVFAVLIGSVVYFYQRYQTIKNNPSIISKEEIKAVTSAIGRFMVLPSDEEPTVATVTDISKLKGQDFFKNAKNGDKLLLYTKAHKAILYRPSSGKIIEFSVLTLGDQNQATPEAQVKDEPISISIYNGTKVANLTSDVEKKLEAFTGITVVSKTNAAKSDYTKTIVIDISGTNAAAAEQVAQLLGGTVEKLPAGESAPQADLLIIAGK